MDVALDGPDDILADRLGAGLRDQGPKDDEGALHGAGRDQHLRNEEITALEAPSHLFEGWDQRLEENVHRVHPQLQSLFSERFDFGCMPVEGVIEELLPNLLFPTHSCPPALGM